MIQRVNKVYFIGIGGIGMSAIARYFNEKGIHVSGYDKTETELTKKLVSEGIEIHYEDNIHLIPKDIDLVVYTPAIPPSHKELSHLIRQGKVPVMKRSQVLGKISEETDTIAVAGTHGKTSTTALVSHLMKYCGENVNAFVGGILSDYNTNYFAGNSPWVVLEADEFDRSFLTLAPEIAILHSMDSDHLDIYGDEREVKKSFIQFLGKTNYGGTMIINEDLVNEIGKDRLANFKSSCKVLTFGEGAGCSAWYDNVKIEGGMTHFTYHYGNYQMDISSFLPGRYNRMNITAALTAVIEAGVNPEMAAEAISVYKGVRRRFEYIYNRDVVYIDDYAHHPTELDAAISAVKELYPGKKVLGIFQPHLYSRTRDFAKGFAKSLDELDVVVLMDIYPAREEPIKGISSLTIASLMNQNVEILSRNEIINKVKEKNYDILLTLGAGDIDTLVPKIKEVLLG